MDGILDKISSYNIFNYLFPGSIFAVIADALTTYQVIQDDIIVGLFFYYFIGLVISRVGSLFLEPALKKLRFVSFVDYSKFVDASNVDPKIDVLSETNSMYRTLCALFIVLLAVTLFDEVAPEVPWLKTSTSYIIGTALLAIFLFSYRKQTSYVVKRVTNVVRKG